MARKSRVFHPGGIYHVMARGNNGQVIFCSNDDRCYFYNLLKDTTKRFEYRIHAFCLMGNHFHMALQMGSIPLSKIMQNIMFRYARFINKRKKTIGHLFQGRYKAIYVDSESYLLGLIRYIHMNPIKAKLTLHPEDYQWSSHLNYIGLQNLPWLTTDWVLSHFAEDKCTAIKLYQNFMQTDPDNVTEFNFKYDDKEGKTFKEDKFLEQLYSQPILPLIPRINLEELVKIVCAYFSFEQSLLKTPSRRSLNNKIRTIIAILSIEMKVANLTTVARYFNRDHTGLSRSIKAFKEKLEIPDDLKKTLFASQSAHTHMK